LCRRHINVTASQCSKATRQQLAVPPEQQQLITVPHIQLPCSRQWQQHWQHCRGQLRATQATPSPEQQHWRQRRGRWRCSAKVHSRVDQVLNMGILLSVVWVYRC
jgi:hypothetical protein